MKPLPPTSSAPTKARPARPSRDSRWKGSFIQPARMDRATPRPPRYPTAAPARGPSVTCRVAKESQWARPPLSPVASAKAIATRTTGRAIPSLRPLSTLRPWRIRTGTSRLLTTACPSAASVGARTAPMRTASQSPRPGRIVQAARAPAATVRGRPMPSSRAGRLPSSRRCARSMRAASVKSTSTSVSSVRPSSRPLPESSHPSCPSANPSPTKAMEARRRRAPASERRRRRRRGRPRTTRGPRVPSEALQRYTYIVAARGENG